MKITLQKLSLKNFKGVQEFTFKPEGQNATISGPNGSGKSTVADALSWLLFDKDSAGSSKFSVKTLDADGAELHNLEHEVEAALEVESDMGLHIFTLRKTMTEKWTKKRGTQTAEMTGHETVYYIDEVPKKESEYKAYVNGMVREDVFRLLTSITHFNVMKWQERRKILLEVAGDITDADVIAANGETFAEIPEIMGVRTFDDTVKMLKARRPKLNDEIGQIGPRIDEALRAKPTDADCIPPQGTRYADLTAKLRNLMNGRSALLAGDTSEIQQQITAKKAEIENVSLAHRKAVMDAEEQRQRIKGEAFTHRKAMEEIDFKRVRLEDARTRLENENQQLREDFGCVTKGESICTSCPLWQEADDSSRATAPGDKAANVEMAEKKKSIQEKGKANKARIEEINEAMKSNEAERGAQKSKTEELEAQAAAIATPEGPNMATLNAELAALQLKLTATGTPDTGTIDNEIAAVQNAIRLHDEAAAASKLAGQIEHRVVELKDLQKKLGAEIDELDRKLMLCESFVRAKVGMLESSVSSKFSPLGFKLFNDQINGGLSEACETLVPSPDGAMVPWSDANTGARIMAGLKIIEVLGLHHGISAPVFVDNAESLTSEIPEMDAQVIRLVATGDHDGLAVKVAQSEETAA